MAADPRPTSVQALAARLRQRAAREAQLAENSRAVAALLRPELDKFNASQPCNVYAVRTQLDHASAAERDAALAADLAQAADLLSSSSEELLIHAARSADAVLACSTYVDLGLRRDVEEIILSVKPEGSHSTPRITPPPQTMNSVTVEHVNSMLVKLANLGRLSTGSVTLTAPGGNLYRVIIERAPGISEP